MAKDALAELESLVEPDRSKLQEYPILSLKERDRRFGLVRKMMEANNVEAMIILPGMDNDNPMPFFTGKFRNRGDDVLFFPLKGEPVISMGRDVDNLMKSEDYGMESWVRDRRFLLDSEKMVEILTERELTSSRIGILVGGNFSRALLGKMTNAFMGPIKKALPNVTSVNLWKPFAQIWVAKSQEEIAMFRKVALALEVVSWEFAHACKVGNSLGDVLGAVMGALLPYGVDIRIPEIGSGPDGGRGMYWKEWGVKPPMIAKGDLISSEVFGWMGPLHGQVQLTVSIGEPSPEKEKLAGLAREAYEIGLKTLRPGITFDQLGEAMGEPNRREGAWRMTPLAHGMNPHEGGTWCWLGTDSPRSFPGAKERFKEEIPWEYPGPPDLVIEEGMNLEFEPNACYGRTYVNIGGNILVTKDGCEELNNISTRMVVVPA